MSQVLAVAGGVIGAVYVLFVPGFVLSFAFFPRGRVDVIERSALSFALSIAVVPLVAFYLNLMGVRISRLNVILEVAGIILVVGVVAWMREQRRVKEPAVTRTDRKLVARKPMPESKPVPAKKPPVKRRIQF